MTRTATPAIPPLQCIAPPPAPARTSADPTRTFAGIAALGAVFAGFLAHDRNPDPLATALAVGITFFGALVALFALHIAYRLAIASTKLAIPVAVILLIGCALDWPWAETAAQWIRAAGHQVMEAAERGWSALQAG
jgi:hypothetical protein